MWPEHVMLSIKTLWFWSVLWDNTLHLLQFKVIFLSHLTWELSLAEIIDSRISAYKFFAYRYICIMLQSFLCIKETSSSINSINSTFPHPTRTHVVVDVYESWGFYRVYLMPGYQMKIWCIAYDCPYPGHVLLPYLYLTNW